MRHYVRLYDDRYWNQNLEPDVKLWLRVQQAFAEVDVGGRWRTIKVHIEITQLCSYSPACDRGLHICALHVAEFILHHAIAATALLH